MKEGITVRIICGSEENEGKTVTSQEMKVRHDTYIVHEHTEEREIY